MSAAERVIARVRAAYGGWRRDTPVDVRRDDWDRLFEPEAARAPAPRVPAVLKHGVEGAWISVPGSHPRALLIYLHGGGFSIGSSRSHHRLVADLSEAAGVRAFALDYRRIPEHGFPAALDDVLSLYRQLRADGLEAGEIVFAGDSAGAQLAISAMLRLRDAGESLPAAAVLMSAWTDLSARGESFSTRGDADPIHDRRMIQAVARAYLGDDIDPADPRVSPLFSDLSGLPPMLLQVGDRETVLSDTTEFTASACAAGCDVSQEIWPEMIHVFQQFPDDLPEARDAIAKAGAFLRRHLEKS